jgi:hypothetical protein
MRTVDLDLDPAAIRPSRETLLYGGLLLNAEVLALLVYALQDDVHLVQPRYAIYGLLWVNVGLWALWRTDVGPADRSTRRKAGALAVGYFAVLAVAGGLVGPGAPGAAGGASIAMLPPGWGPALLYSGPVTLVLMPAKVIGYVALAYLVYATAVDAAGAAVSGILGFFSCVSCSWPIVASLASSVLGGGTALATTALGASYDISTAVFLLTVGLLYWRPLLR